ncbi:unnamed protein product [Durusdinium trenchii]|uniref:Uncharacterized protein n=2 Tax=Durusdinium trenchii TaxID=1381693 RepID=A0ABP0RDX5_9DINO
MPSTSMIVSGSVLHGLHGPQVNHPWPDRQSHAYWDVRQLTLGQVTFVGRTAPPSHARAPQGDVANVFRSSPRAVDSLVHPSTSVTKNIVGCPAALQVKPGTSCKINLTAGLFCSL